MLSPYLRDLLVCGYCRERNIVDHGGILLIPEDIIMIWYSYYFDDPYIVWTIDDLKDFAQFSWKIQTTQVAHYCYFSVTADFDSDMYPDVLNIWMGTGSEIKSIVCSLQWRCIDYNIQYKTTISCKNGNCYGFNIGSLRKSELKKLKSKFECFVDVLQIIFNDDTINDKQVPNWYKPNVAMNNRNVILWDINDQKSKMHTKDDHNSIQSFSTFDQCFHFQLQLYDEDDDDGEECVIWASLNMLPAKVSHIIVRFGVIIHFRNNKSIKSQKVISTLGYGSDNGHNLLVGSLSSGDIIVNPEDIGSSDFVECIIGVIKVFDNNKMEIDRTKWSLFDIC